MVALSADGLRLEGVRIPLSDGKRFSAPRDHIQAVYETDGDGNPPGTYVQWDGDAIHVAADIDDVIDLWSPGAVTPYTGSALRISDDGLRLEGLWYPGMIYSGPIRFSVLRSAIVHIREEDAVAVGAPAPPSALLTVITLRNMAIYVDYDFDDVVALWDPSE